MSPVRTTFRRTVGRARGLFSVILAATAALSLAAYLFSLGLESAEGGRLSLSVVLAAALAPVLPALAAFLAMDVWSDERQSGRIDLLLSVAVRERDFVIGKFLGVWAMLLFVITLFDVAAVGVLGVTAPRAVAGASLLSLAFAWFALALQAAAWSAAAVMFSAVCSRAASALCAGLLFLVALPRGIWAGILAFGGTGRLSLGEMPFDAHVVDLASGLVPVGTVASYLAVTLILLFVATKCVAAIRLVGRGARSLRLSTGAAIALAAAVAALAVLFFARTNPTLDVSSAGAAAALSPRTRSILSEAGGVTVTCFLPRNDARFRSVSRLLRLFGRESESLGGGALEIRYVDPRWDIGAAERLVHAGVSEASVVFERGRRIVSVPVDDAFGERLCAATIRRVSASRRRRNVYWTTGHGESSFDGYGAFGMSDIARDLAREGFQNLPIDLAATEQVPSDCALILVAGARNDFSRLERGRLDAYLRGGGRLLVLLGAASDGGIGSMLPAWGLKPSELPVKAAATLSGADVVVSQFSDHEVSAPLKGSRIVMERPLAFVASSVAETGTGVDRIAFSPVAEVGESVVVAAVERGGGTGKDLALRPTRIVAIGDRSFALNGALGVRASANRDFFLNCVAYLSGMDAHAFGGDGCDTLDTGLDRRARLGHLVATAGGVPLVFFLVLVAGRIRRNRRA